MLLLYDTDEFFIPFIWKKQFLHLILQNENYKSNAMKILKKLTFIASLLQSFFSFCYSENYNEGKTYFVKPIDVVCDYPFNDTTKWAITCRVWGLLKYFHTNVTAGKFDWDQVLIETIGKINEARTPEQVNNELMQMIRIAGDYNYSKDTSWNDSLNMNVNLCWLEHSFINDSIRQALRAISSMSIAQPSHYIKPHENMASVPYPNEKEYGVETILTFEYRLLALFRYWNVIYYFYPYKYLMDQSWDVMLSEFIPQFMTALDSATYHIAVNKLSTRLNDGHGFTNASSSPIYNQLNFKYIVKIDSSTVVRTPFEGSLLEKGDIILSIDGQNIQSVRDSIASLIVSSNKHFTDNGVNCSIFFTFRTGCQLTILRNEQVMTINEKRKFYSIDPDSASYHRISPTIGYVNLDKLKDSVIPSMIDSLNDCKGIIFDLRNYPLNFRSWDIISHLSSTQEYHYALATEVDFFHYGAFFKYDCVTKCPDSLWQARKSYTGKTVVLVNAATMSWAETLSMMFRIHGATIVGTPTAGANGNVVRFSLPGQITVQYSGIGFYYPDGTQMQRTGIIPDIEVYPTMDDIMAGRDEVLEAAISFLNSN